jgi:DNA ligase-1
MIVTTSSPPVVASRWARLAGLVDLADTLSRSRNRADMLRRIGLFLRDLPSAERPAAARLLTGRPVSDGDPRHLAVSAKSLWGAAIRLDQGREAPPWPEEPPADLDQAVARLVALRPPTATESPLTLREVVRAFDALAAGRGREATARRESLLARLLRRATPAEAAFLTRCVLGERRSPVGEGVLSEAIGRAVGAPVETVRRAAIYLGDIGLAAGLAFDRGAAALAAVAPRPFHPLRPMLARSVPSLEAAWAAAAAPPALEFKLDGTRVQIHVERDEVRLFSRRLHDVTDLLPDIVTEIRGALVSRRAILEGEVLYVDPEGRPRPARGALPRDRGGDPGGLAPPETPLRLFLFDLLLEGEDCLIERPYRERWERLLEVHGGLTLVPRCLPRALAEAQAFWQAALEAGHEGLLLKELAAPYTPGGRGGHWLKLKRADSLDLVIVAAAYGAGRHGERLGRYRLAARDEETGELRPVGTTSRGLTEEESRGLNARLLAHRRGESAGVLSVEPVIVVEVQYAEIRSSARHPDGLALRVARIGRIRDDKLPTDADTLQHMRRLFDAQGKRAESG